MTKLMTQLTRLAALACLVAVLGASAVRADPMKCSGEDKTCQQNCAKAAKVALTICLTNCGVRKSACLRTGCWDDGTRRYCGLTKQ